MSDETLKKSVAGELNVFNALWNHDFSVSGSLMKALKFNTVVVPAYNEYKEKQKQSKDNDKEEDKDKVKEKDSK